MDRNLGFEDFLAARDKCRIILGILLMSLEVRDFFCGRCLGLLRGVPSGVVIAWSAYTDGFIKIQGYKILNIFKLIYNKIIGILILVT